MAQQFILPDLGEGIAEAQIVSVLVKEGDTVKEDQDLMEVETDKASVPIPSPYAGAIAKIHVRQGQTVNVGDVMITFSDGPAGGDKPAQKGETAKGRPRVAAMEQETETESRPAAGMKSEAADAREPKEAPQRVADRTTPAAPVVRKLAREMGVDISTIRGSGPGGRVLREDVEEAARGDRGRPEPQQAGRKPAADRPRATPEERPATRPSIAQPRVEIEGVADEDKWGPVKRQSMTQIRKTIAKQMTLSYTQIPHVTHADLLDGTIIESMRVAQKRTGDTNGPKVTLLAFLTKALVNALQRYPKFNASLDTEKEQIVFKEYYNIGIAVDTERGLVVPVIRNVDRKSIGEIAADIAGVADKARRSAFSIEDLRGGTFTITNPGPLGGMFFTPIINYPEVAILGLGRGHYAPRIVDGKLETRFMVPICMSFDHRICDGAEAARFVSDIMSQLESPARLLL